MIEKYVQAGKILRKVKEEVRDKVRAGAKMLEIAEFVEGRIKDLGAEPAFPCNISINRDAAHCTPSKNDKRVFREGDLIKIDIGAHIDGYIADTAFTVDLGDNQDLVKAAEEALKNALDIIEAGVNTAEIGAIIEKTVKDFGFNPVYNLTGHGLERYTAHAEPTIFNYGVKKGVELKEGMVIAIEPFVTNGVGKVVERSEVEIYSLINPKSVRMRIARDFIKEIFEKYRTLPFAKRWLKNPREIILSKLVKEKVLRPYPVLTEVSGGLVSQAEHTVIVREDGAEIIT